MPQGDHRRHVGILDLADDRRHGRSLGRFLGRALLVRLSCRCRLAGTDRSACHSEAETITVVLDNARYKRSRELKAWLDQPGCRLRLIYLPSHAPDLNLTERFWHFFERQVLFNKSYETFALFKQVFDQFLERLHEHEADLATLITNRFHLIRHPKTGIPSA
ncbi:transposase [Methylobacterium aquaticum]|uniref:transposase n=1 Tax=Methylobacterium aquaticum TaxID=270351 RepID=UPI0009E22A52|nr:transposase [Methylobacterium aquaticum]